MTNGRRVSLARFVGGLVLVVVAAAATYLVVVNWQLRRWLRSRAEVAGCSLEYVSATALVPGQFRVQGARLADCRRGWSARVVDAQGTVALRSLIWGPVELESLDLELDSLRFGSVALHGKLHVVVDSRAPALHASVRTGELSLHQHGETLLTSGRTRVDVEVPAPAPSGNLPASVSFTVHSFTSAPLALAAKEPVEGTVAARWDGRASRLELRDGSVPSVPWLLANRSIATTLQLHEGAISPAGVTARGRLTMRGQSPNLLLKALRLPESLIFTFSGLKDAPFTLSANASYSAGGWKFQDVDFKAEDASMSGTVAISGANRSGTLRLVYRGLPMGIHFANEQSDLIVEPPAGWPHSGT